MKSLLMELFILLIIKHMEEVSQGNIGEMLKQARLNKNLTQTQLAEKVGKKRSYISRIEGEEGN